MEKAQQSYHRPDFARAVAALPRRIRVVDTHTEGEPTRVIVDGGPELSPGSAQEHLEQLRRHHDDLRALVVREPRGADPVVGAWLGAPKDPEAVAQVVFSTTSVISGCASTARSAWRARSSTSAGWALAAIGSRPR
jgi:proline racemase